MDDFATMYPIGTDSPEEAARFWQEKKEREEAAAKAVQAKVVRPSNRKEPNVTRGAETK